MPRKERGRWLTCTRDSIDTMTQRLHKKARAKTDYSDQKQQRQHKHQQNKNNQKTKMGRKTTVCVKQATNKQNFTGEDLDMAKKRKQ